MEYILLEETPFETLYRDLAWRAFQYFLCNQEILNDEKYENVYNELLKYFIQRRKAQFNLSYIDVAQMKNLAKMEYYCFVHNKNFTKEKIDDFVKNYNLYKNLLVIRPKKPLD